MAGKSWRGILIGSVVAVVVVLGFSLRILQDRLPFQRPAAPAATLYFLRGKYLYPVSRSLDSSADAPRVSLEALLQGPKTGSGLTSAIPSGVRLLSLSVSGDLARVDLSAEFRQAEDSALARMVVVDTLTALPSISSVVLSVDGNTLETAPLKRVPLLHFASDMGMMAVPTRAVDARAALDAYLAGPPESEWNGLPIDVHVTQYGFSGGIVSVRFPYTESIRSLAVARPDRMRMALLGLITTLTEYRDVKAVRMDFDGNAQPALESSSDLLLSIQPRPRLLNDERILGL
ncbi:MAG: GerMN domain-containing protein [Bryobacteraceae bacterium]